MNNLREQAASKVAPLSKMLSERHGITLDFDAGEEHLLSVIEHYQNKRDALLISEGRTDALSNPEYGKAVLISETARMYLREIAPKRIRRKAKKK